MQSIWRGAIGTALILSSTAWEIAWADDPPKPVAGTIAGVLEASGITASGYIAASYYHSNGYRTFHQFDVQHAAFQLDQAAMTLSYLPKDGFGALLGVTAGEDMKILHAAEDGNSNTIDLVQGFIQYSRRPHDRDRGQIRYAGGR